MADPRFARLSELLSAALELPEPAREEFLRGATPLEPDLLAAALAALRVDDTVSDPERAWREQLVAALPPVSADGLDGENSAPEPRRCGPWRLLRSIGEGGMGKVFLAERADGAFEQRVAVKVLPPSARTRELGQRLERERQILARLEHPGIARLVDGGLADDGTPYFALELVEGVTVDRYCADPALARSAKLAIFLRVADAVAYAHARLVVHRDLKPGNILVRGDGEVKLLDFGIAKLLEEDDLGLTRSVDRMHTPRYAAPEQIEGQPASTATDVHALGLLLYELLAGAPPFGGPSASALSLAREIVEREPPPPSQRPSLRLSGRRARGLARDLDEICLKALRKRPEERYESVSAMADDVRRAIDGFPVQALAGARLYRARKFAVRHATALSLVALVLVALASGLLVALSQRDRALASEARALASEARSHAVQDFLVDDLLFASTPEEARGRKPLVEEALALAARRAGGALAAQPEVEHHVRGVLGEAFLRLGALDLAGEQIERERALGRSLALPPDAAHAADMRALRLSLASADHDAALELARQLDRDLETNAPASEGRWLAHAYLGLALQRRGNYAAAESFLRQAEAGLAAIAGAGRAKLEVLSLLVANLSLQRKDIATEPVARRLIDETTALLGADHPDRVRALNGLAQVLRRMRRRVEARQVAEQAIELGERVLGPARVATLDARLTLAFIQWDQRDFAAAEREGERILALSIAGLGANHFVVARAQELLAILLSARGEFARPAELYANALATFRETYGELHPVTLRTMRNMVSFHRRRGDVAAQRSAAAAILALARRARDEPALDPVLTTDLAYFAVNGEPAELRDPALAVELARRAVEATERKWVDAFSTLSLALDRAGDPAGAIAALEEAFENPDAWLAGNFARRLHVLLDEHGADGATERFLERLARSRRTLYPNDRNLEGETLLLLATHELDRDRAAVALGQLDSADRHLSEENPPTDARRVAVALARADALTRLARAPEARAGLTELLRKLEGEPAADPDDRDKVEQALARAAGQADAG